MILAGHQKEVGTSMQGVLICDGKSIPSKPRIFSVAKLFIIKII